LKLLILLLILGSLLSLSHAQDLSGETLSKVEKKKKKKRKKEVDGSGEIGVIKFGMASFYANKFVGRKTATGEIFDQSKFTCACNVAPLGTWVKVTNLSNSKEVVVKINDRLHAANKRVVDLSKIAARRLDFLSKGLTRVKVEVIGKIEGRRY